MTRKVLLVVNGSAASAMGIRARGLAANLPERYSAALVFRPEQSGKVSGMNQLLCGIVQHQPDIVYVLDMAAAGVAAALRYKLRRRVPVIIDTGDAITALARSAQLRGPAGLAATWLLEEAGLRFANHIVVRGSRHEEILAKRGVRATWIPDGYERELFYPPTETATAGERSLGLMGSIIWNGSIEATYGWDLVETLALLPDLPLRGILIGDGTGLAPLQDYARQRGVAGRLEFLGRIAYAQLCPYLHRMDICLSTQTNDLPGQVRTTGKLPLYLATGRFILASRVGEAARVLPAEMLVDFAGTRDPNYPAKLAGRLRELMQSEFDLAAAGRRLAQTAAPRFEYGRLGEELARVLDEL